jgi:CRISPR-associated protein Cmr6
MRWFIPRDKAWKTPYPLPADTAETVMADDGGACDNFGLLLDRYVAYSASKGGIQLVREFADRRVLVPRFKDQPELFEAYRQRWQDQAESLQAVTFTAHPHWRVIVGLSHNAVLETGMTVHPVFGFPVVPGSCLKGAARVYATHVAEAPPDHIDVQFGWQSDEQSGCGNLVFLEGGPVVPPWIDRDVVNPIFGEYYQGDRPPAGYLSPSPLFFLALGRRSRYQFGVASLDGDRRAAEEGCQWLQGALQHIGVGAKTAAGYGYWSIESDA